MPTVRSAVAVIKGVWNMERTLFQRDLCAAWSEVVYSCSLSGACSPSLSGTDDRERVGRWGEGALLAAGASGKKGIS